MDCRKLCIGIRFFLENFILPSSPQNTSVGRIQICGPQNLHYTQSNSAKRIALLKKIIRKAGEKSAFRMRLRLRQLERIVH
jgi:hypothetical protein